MTDVSPALIDHLIRWEGVELEAYRDVAGVWTIGAGHTGPAAFPGNKITEGAARMMLAEEAADFRAAVVAMATEPLTDGQADAFAGLAYNIGVNALRGSTAMRRHNAGAKPEQVAEAIKWWNKATVNGRKQVVLGLTRRRHAEAEWYVEASPSDEGVVAAPGRCAVV